LFCLRAYGQRRQTEIGYFRNLLTSVTLTLDWVMAYCHVALIDLLTTLQMSFKLYKRTERRMEGLRDRLY